MKGVFNTFIDRVSVILKEKISSLSFVLILCIISISTALLSINTIGATYQYFIGDIAKENIRVSKDIQYRIDSETEKRKNVVAEMSPLVFDRDQSVLIKKLKKIETLFELASNILKENPPIGTADRTFQLVLLKSRLSKHTVYADRILLNILKYENLVELRRIINRILIYIYDEGILERTYNNPINIKNRNIVIRTINTSADVNEISRSIDSLRTRKYVKKKLYNICYSVAPNISTDQLKVVYYLVKRNLKTNLKFNIEETKRRIKEKIKEVKPVMGLLKKGQTLIREGDVITTEVLNKIEILNKHTSSTNINFILGVLLLQLAFLFISFYFFFEFYNNRFFNDKIPIIGFTLILFFILYTFFLSRMENIFDTNIFFTMFLPIPFITMILTCLYSIHISLIVGVYIIFFSFIISSGSIPIVVLAFSSVVLGVLVVNDVDKRKEFIRGGFIIGFVNSIVVIAVSLMEEIPFYDVLKNIQLSFANGIINSILVLGVFPIFENLFGVTTKFKLQELSDLNAPIFKDMLINAPGTYNHSVIVANMTEVACKEIGANHLLARVGGYYHDIGKLEDAGIFIENRISDRQVIDFTPEEYSIKIISHVEKGVKLAIKEGLPDSIIEFIRDHHGTTIMTFFYHQALELAENSGENNNVNKSIFQYPGPKPGSRETAIVMIADSIEAASRSLQKPTTMKIEGLVKKVIYNKLNEGELEDSDLTMLDINKIQKSFIGILLGIFHTRIEYPEKEELEKLENRVINSENNS